MEWIAIRKEKHGIKTLTPRSWSMVVSRADVAGTPIREVLLALCDHGWQTWKAAYGKSRFATQDKGASHDIPRADAVRHNSDLQLGDPSCACLSCKAARRDGGTL